jgi:hypothetical protein
MAECDWAILCDYAFLDVSRKMCMIGIFDRIFAPRVPAALNHSSLAMRILGQPNETVQFRVDVVRPNGGQLINLEGTVQVGDTGKTELQFNIAQLALPDYGLYSFNIYEGQELLKTVGFLVAQPPQPTQTPQQQG